MMELRKAREENEACSQAKCTSKTDNREVKTHKPNYTQLKRVNNQKETRKNAIERKRRKKSAILDL